MATVAIELLGTLFSTEPLRQRLVAIKAPEITLELWLAEASRDLASLCLTGRHAPYERVLAATLPRTLATVGLSAPEPSKVELVLKGLSVLNPVEGAQAALELLAGAGHRLVAFTDLGPACAQALLDRAGLRARFEALVSSVQVGIARPSPSVYAALAAKAGPTWVVSAHALDVTGAQQAGLGALWLRRRERVWVGAVPAPDRTELDLPGAARALVSDGVGLPIAASA